MRFERKARLLPAVVPTASMADIAFLLIIFFMVTTAYTLDPVPMELPQTRQQEQMEKGTAIISIAHDEALRFSAGEEETRPVADIDALDAEIRRVVAGNTLHPFAIRADQQVKYRVIDQVLEQLRQAGARNVTLLSRAEEER